MNRYTPIPYTVASVCIYIYIYIYIRGVTVHKINGSVRYDIVHFRYGGQGNWLGCNVGNISVLNHEGELY